METLHRVMPHLFTYVLLKTPCQTSESKEAEDEVIVSGKTFFSIYMAIPKCMTYLKNATLIVIKMT